MTREEADILRDLWRFSVSEKYTEKEIRDALDKTIKALKQERQHGEWKYAIVDCYKSGYICPHCNGFAVIDGKSDGYSVTFCPNCGSNNRPKEGEAK